MFSKKFIWDALERAGATFAQVAISFTLVAATAGGGLTDVPWVLILNVGGLAALVSLLKSVYARFQGDPESASLIDLETK